jgi:hypothetical protein
MMTLKDSAMSEENNEGQMIYLHAAQVFWHTKLGKKLVSNTKGTEEMPIKFVSRAKNTLDINRFPETMNSLQMALFGTKKVHNFRVIKLYSSKPISRSFAYLEKDYEQNFQ